MTTNEEEYLIRKDDFIEVTEEFCDEILDVKNGV